MSSFHRRKGPAAALLAILSAIHVAPTGTAAAGTAIPFTDGFESGDTARWPRKGVEGGGTVGVTAAPAGGNGRAARFTMPDDGSYRAEIATDRLPYGSYRYTFSNHLPSDWVRYERMTIVSQWHGGTGTIPAIALAVKNDRWVMDVHWQVGSQPVQGVKYDLGTVRFGHWNRWAFDITWSTATTPGSIAVSRDGAAVGSHQGPNSYHQETAPYHKIGLYRPNWKAEKGHAKGGSPAVMAHYDDVAIATLSSGPGKPPPAPSSPTAPKPTTPSPQGPSASASAPPSTATPASPAPTTTTEDLAGDTDLDTDIGAPDPARDTDSGTLAGTRNSDSTPLLLTCAGALLIGALCVAVRSGIKRKGRANR
ncbi:polysaccharide lyase (plasmid) [Embleya sp. NBC_00888]|uniref:heparin lyase I family protein n=1 Tax=Embleya sp. NBC_00888 TaxID=2975960 RepID=UPI002F907003|nr:polysaccharide lyase [Embleya sp. NBC_00888]